MMKPCRFCDKPFKPDKNNQFFCCAKCRVGFTRRYGNESNWFANEWAKWKLDFAAQKLSAAQKE